MKGTVETEVIITIGIIMLTVATILMLYEIINEIINEFARASAEVVARDVASMITLSAAAPHNIQLNYQADLGHRYEYKIFRRGVDSELILSDNRDCGELFPGIKADVSDRFCKGVAKIGIDGINKVFIANVVKIEKTATRAAGGVSFGYSVGGT